MKTLWVKEKLLHQCKWILKAEGSKEELKKIKNKLKQVPPAFCREYIDFKITDYGVRPDGTNDTPERRL